MTCHFSCRKGHVTSFYHEAHLMKDMSPAPIMKDISLAPVMKMLSLNSAMEPVSLSAKNKLSKTFTTGNYDDVEITSVTKSDSLTMRSVLQQLNVSKHPITGDGSCLYHAIAHQAGFINRSSRGEKIVSEVLRQIVLKMMAEYPAVRLEDGLSTAQWLQRKLKILDPAQWGGDLEVRLLAIGLKRDIVVLTVAQDGSTYSRRFPCQPPPVPKMSGGIFIPLSTNELCGQWKSLDPTPLLIIYNGHSHYDSTVNM